MKTDKIFLVTAAVVLFALNFSTHFLFETNVTTHMVIDGLVIASMILLAMSVYDMVSELRIAIVGIVIMVLSQIIENWSECYNLQISEASMQIMVYAVFFLGTVMVIYGFLDFKEKYNFKAK